MTWIREISLAVFGFSFGVMVAGGVFTVLFVVGLIPRFAGKTDTARHEMFYEECIIAGSVAGCLFSVFQFPYKIGQYMQKLPMWAYQSLTVLALVIIGVFSGMFVGCLALAIAEMLDSIPILARRIGFRHGLGIVVLAIAVGKLVGSLLYFCMRIFETAQ